MKKVFVPKGETVSYNCLCTGRLVVKGVLRVSGKLEAKEIIGGGIIEAREIVCDDLRASCVTADFMTARRVAVDKLFVKFECRAQDIAVMDYASAGYMNAGKLSVTLSDIGACDADEIITLRRKNSLLGLLWGSWWRSFFLELFHGGEKKARQDEKKAEDARKAEPSAPAGSVIAAANSQTAPIAPDDATIDMLIAVLTELQKQGYRVSKADTPASGREEAAA